MDLRDNKTGRRLVALGYILITMGIVPALTGCRTPEQRRLSKAYGFVVNARIFPFDLGDNVAKVRKALTNNTGQLRFSPEITDPMPKFKDYRYMTAQCSVPGDPKKQCGLFLFFQADGRLVSIYAAHPLDVTSTPEINVNWIAGFRIPSLDTPPTP